MYKAGLDEADIDLLMELQYGFPIQPKPYDVIAERLGMDIGEVMDRIRTYKTLGIVKRVGFYVHYSSMGLAAALVGLSVPEDRMPLLSGILGREQAVTHAYIRDHPEYNVWIVVKSRPEGITRLVNRIRLDAGIHGYVILPSIRTYKLSVKYDLRRGVSWSPWRPSSSRGHRPFIDKRLLGKLRDIPVVRSPFRSLAEELGIGVEELLEAIRKLLDSGVLRDAGASLNGLKLGFNHNVLMAVRDQECCLRVLRGVPEATHVVLRKPCDAWMYRCYIMAHAVSRAMADRVIERVEGLRGCSELQALYSIRDLKPGVVR